MAELAEGQRSKSTSNGESLTEEMHQGQGSKTTSNGDESGSTERSGFSAPETWQGIELLPIKDQMLIMMDSLLQKRLKESGWSTEEKLNFMKKVTRKGLKNYTLTEIIKLTAPKRPSGRRRRLRNGQLKKIIWNFYREYSLKFIQGLKFQQQGSPQSA